MKFPDLLEKFADAVHSRNGAAMAALFTEDGVYDDIYFGEFHGRERIAWLIDEGFYDGGRDFKWEFRNPVCDGDTGYAFWLFSYTSTSKHAAGTRVTFDGVGIFHLNDGLIERYEDMCNGVVPLKQMGTPPDVVDRMAGKWLAALKARDGYDAHQIKGD